MKYAATMILIAALTGCAKTAPETATEAVLAQIDVVEQAVKRECPQVKIDKETDALRATVKTQLKACESKLETAQSQRNTWIVVALGLILAIASYIFGKTRKMI